VTKLSAAKADSGGKVDRSVGGVHRTTVEVSEKP